VIVCRTDRQQTAAGTQTATDSLSDNKGCLLQPQANYRVIVIAVVLVFVLVVVVSRYRIRALVL